MHDRPAKPHRGARRNGRNRGRKAALGTAIVLLAACGSAAKSHPSSSVPATAAVPAQLGSTQGEAVGRTVDGIKCQVSEQVLFHIHAHLAVYVAGRLTVVPEGIGIAAPRTADQTATGPFVTGGSCFYWLHGHTADGIIHVESPIRRTYTLGNYFDLWNQTLSATRVAAAAGPVTAYVDGRRFAGDPRQIPLASRSAIQLDVGTVVPPAAYSFPSGY